MKKYVVCAMLLAAVAQQANAQGYYLYKNGVRQAVLATDVDSLVFFKEQEQNPDEDPLDPANPAAAKDATNATADRNTEWYGRLDFEDLTELENAKRGLIEATPNLVITNADGQEVWDMKS